MQPNDEPVQEQIEKFVTDEERDILARPGVPTTCATRSSTAWMRTATPT